MKNELKAPKKKRLKENCTSKHQIKNKFQCHSKSDLPPHKHLFSIIMNISFLHLSIITFKPHILHTSLHHHAYAFNILFVLHVCSYMILVPSSTKQKQKKGSMKIHDAFLVACVRYHEPTMLGS